MRDVQCKNCTNLKAAWCAMKEDSPDPELIRGCQYFKQMTNANRIRAMSDEELADLLFRWMCKSLAAFLEKGGAGCMNMVELKEWLQQPAKEETP